MTRLLEPTETGQTPFLQFARILLASFVGALGVLAILPSAGAHNNSGWVWIGDAKIYNYDYRSTQASLDNADWPINVIFWNNATVAKIKAERQDIFEYNCNVLNFCNMNHRSYQPDGAWAWDTDGGRKEFRCGYSGGADQWALHYRAYDNDTAGDGHGDGSGNEGTLFSPGWGYFVPVSSHYDIDDPGLPLSDCDATAHGYDETAEGWMVNYYDAVNGWQGVDDWTVHLHAVPPALRVIGGTNHYGNGNGKASIVYVP